MCRREIAHYLEHPLNGPHLNECFCSVLFYKCDKQQIKHTGCFYAFHVDGPMCMCALKWLFFFCTRYKDTADFFLIFVSEFGCVSNLLQVLCKLKKQKSTHVLTWSTNTHTSKNTHAHKCIVYWNYQTISTSPWRGSQWHWTQPPPCPSAIALSPPTSTATEAAVLQNETESL